MHRRQCQGRLSGECGTVQMVFHTSFGWAGVVATDKGVCRIVLPMGNKRDIERKLTNTQFGAGDVDDGARHAWRILKRAVAQLRGFFSGKGAAFDLPLDLRCHTPFQQSVWAVAQEIPCGETRSYAWIAARIGRPRSARAVGQAMGANPVPIIIP